MVNKRTIFATQFRQRFHDIQVIQLVFLSISQTDIDIESENDVTPIICESKSNHVEEQKEPKHNLEPNSTPKIKRYDVTDGIRRSASPKPPPPIRKTPEKVRKSLELSVTQTQNTDTTTDTKTESKTEETEALKTESHIEGKCIQLIVEHKTRNNSHFNTCHM